MMKGDLMQDSHIILSGEEMYAIMNLVKEANRIRGVPVSRIWEEIAIFAKTQREKSC
jgi:hypothetical protein